VGVNSITRAEVAEEGTSLTATNDLASDRLSGDNLLTQPEDDRGLNKDRFRPRSS
jgi:hypothetical protein